MALPSSELMTEKRDPFPEFEGLVDQLIEIPRDEKATVAHKMDLLERLIERWRIKEHRLANNVQFEEFLVWDWLADEGKLHLKQTKEPIDLLDTGTPPLRLQRQLLVFLLLHHGEFKDVLECIEGFVRKIRKDLDVRDFKKTKTGVFRCFTNTRFAANKLRSYGLLKYTRQERFKVWVLSLPGIIVAARTLQSPTWGLPAQADPWHGLDEYILRCLWEVKDFPALVETLTSICEPDTQVFETFDHVLKEGHTLMGRYWDVLQNSELTNREREEEGRARIEQLDQIVGYSDFLEEFVSCIQITKLLEQADKAAQKL